MKYVLDTSIISAVLKYKKTSKSRKTQYDSEVIVKKYNKAILGGAKFFITAISYYEIKRGLLKINASKQLDKFTEFYKKYEMLLFDSVNYFDIAAKIWADLQKRGKLSLKDADILIASIAIAKELTLVTTDKGFNDIPNFNFENWYEET